MKYFFSSIRTMSYWRYALLSSSAAGRILAFLGGFYLLLEMLDFFRLHDRERYESYTFFVVVAAAVFFAVITRPPVSKITYRIPKRDFSYEVLIGDLLENSAPNIVISTNSTFDTDIASGLISADSLQGKFTNTFFAGNTEKLDGLIEKALEGISYQKHPEGAGKKRRYPIGTVAKVPTHGKIFYLLAMSELNAGGNAQSNATMIDTALEALWDFIASRGEHGDTATAIIGTGRGRVRLTRKKVIERIAQSFADASQDKVFSNRLVIVVRSEDADKFGVNLFEIRDYLMQSLHV